MKGAGSGSPLPSSVIHEMSQKIGADFSDVHIHTGPEAAMLSDTIGARAFAHKNDIFFNTGEYNSGSVEGKRLLAHELTHVIQQSGRNNIIQRTSDSETLRRFDDIAAEIRAHDAYRRLNSGNRRLVREIIWLARSRDNAIYYITRLRDLINTPDAPRTARAATVSQEFADYALDEQKRLAQPAAAAAADREEKGTADPSRVWTRRRGEDRIWYYVDARDVNQIFIKIKVRPRPRGRGTQVDVNRLISMEDAIEKYASTYGYSVDL